jgi:hypothetical protein
MELGRAGYGHEKEERKRGLALLRGRNGHLTVPSYPTFASACEDIQS